MKNRPKGLVYKPRKTKKENAFCKNCGLYFEYNYKGKPHLYCSEECKKAQDNYLYWQKNKARINEQRSKANESASCVRRKSNRLQSVQS